ncbi:MAG: transposase, partial [Candidatus Omnitrophica bacterium]|nr:transposase [Candidatus Omnitrophota bacterium]
LKKYQEQYKIKIFSYALMSDHLHLMVDMEKFDVDETKPAARSQVFSDFMHDLNNSYTKYFNSRNDRKGHLFRERFKAALIEKEHNYFLKMTAYIHLNPQRLGLTDDARKYAYSSYRHYLADPVQDIPELNIRQTIDEVLNLLNGKDYATFVSELTREEAEVIHKRLERGKILGSDEFVQKVKDEVENYQSQDEDDESQPGNYRLLVATGAITLILLASAGGIYFYLEAKKSGSQEMANAQVKTQAIEKTAKLKADEWEIKLVPLAGGGQMLDSLTFRDGKFSSKRLELMGFSGSNYSLLVDDKGKLTWETMQSTTQGGTASWHGEIDHEAMRGILSLRQQGKEPQDFSFMSSDYRRID